MNKKSFLLSGAAALLLFIGAGCSNNGASDAYNENDTTVTEQPAPAPANNIDTFNNPDTTMTDTGM